ncbi:MAG: hypothetical protein ACNA7W_04360, partial [Pseudomonadales bacterium]
HLHLGEPLQGGFADAEAMAEALDRVIVGGMRVFPTHVLAARRLRAAGHAAAVGPAGNGCGSADGAAAVVRDSDVAPLERVMQVFDARIAACPPEEVPYLLGGYGNLLRNRQLLGLD